MSTTDFPAALIAARQQDHAALQALALQHLPLVMALTKRFPPGQYDREELYQQGCVGLMKALQRYDPGRGVSFATYAVPVILGEMRQLRRLNRPIHVPRPEEELRMRIRRCALERSASLGREATVQEIASALAMDARELMLHMEEIDVASWDAPCETGSSLADALADPTDWLTRLELRTLVEQLPPQDRTLMELRYLQGLTQAETARRLGLTQVQISRREMLLRRQLRRIWYGT